MLLSVSLKKLNCFQYHKKKPNQKKKRRKPTVNVREMRDKK